MGSSVTERHPHALRPLLISQTTRLMQDCLIQDCLAQAIACRARSPDLMMHPDLMMRGVRSSDDPERSGVIRS